MNALSTPVWLWQTPALVLAIGYLLGSIPFGLILARIGGAGDLRQIGSGNIGATNVLRTGRKGLAAATLLLDLAKGAAAVAIGERLLPGGGPAAGAAALVGHCYPVWLRFAGGKGVATMMGVAAALSWIIGAVFAAVWIAALLLSRRSSVGGIAAAASAPAAALAIGRTDLAPLLLGLALIVLWRHRANIARLIDGTEPRIGASRAG